MFLFRGTYFHKHIHLYTPFKLVLYWYIRQHKKLQSALYAKIYGSVLRLNIQSDP